MNLFRLYFRRNAAVCCILILLLTLAVSFCALGVTSLVSTGQQLHAVSSQYTTIAVPTDDLTWLRFLSKDANEVDTAAMENGTGEAFLEALKAQGYESVFEVFDMGFRTVAGSLIAARDNALQLFGIGLAVFLLGSLLFFVILLQRLKPVIRSMRHIGVKPKRILMELLAVLLGSAACAVAVGTVLSAALFGQISGLLLSGGIALSPATNGAVIWMKW